LTNNNTIEINISPQKEYLKPINFNFENNKDLINLNNESEILQESKNKNKKYFVNNQTKSYATNFMEIILRIKRNFSKVTKIDSSEMNILFSDLENKVKNF